MKKQLLLMIIIPFFVIAKPQNTILQSDKVEVTYKGKPFEIARETDIRCREVPFDGQTFWSENFPKKSVPDFCKKTFITTVGMLSPMHIYDGIETFGELEVLDFIEEAQDDPNMLLIDTRKPNWYQARTIPTAINLPFFYITQRKKNPKNFEKALKYLQVKKSVNGYDFSKAKTILLFCNATWCLQSPKMIDALVELGYPHKKIKWYRGGLQAWLNVNLTTVTGE